MVLGNAMDLAAMRLDLLEPPGDRIVPIGPPTNLKFFERARQGQFGLVRRPPLSGEKAMPCDALLCTRRRREAQVQIPGLGRERAQAPDGHGVIRRGFLDMLHASVWDHVTAHREQSRYVTHSLYIHPGTGYDGADEEGMKR